MSDIATLGVKVDSTGAERGSARVNKSVGGMRKSFGGLKSLLVTVGLTAFFLKTVKDAKVFQQAIADLSAITGATGEDLEFLSDKAREFGATTTLTASEAAEAFKLIASAKPDLLESGEALAKVTKAAITLAEAAGTTLPQAAMTLGSALNQFSADAEEAGRFINVLAAGAKFGASEIPETAEAMRMAGTVAASMGISFEQANASIQSLASIAIKGSEAGAALRNVFLRLESSANKNLRPSVVGLDKALDELAAQNLSAGEMTKLFGLRAITAAQQLVKQRKEVAILTEKLTDTVTAYEQAAIKVDTLEGDVKALNSAFESFSITLGDKSNPALRDMTQTLTLAVKLWGEAAASGDANARIWESLTDVLVMLIKATGSVAIAFSDMGDWIGATSAQVVAAFKGDVAAIDAIAKARKEASEAANADFEKFNNAIDNRKEKFAEMKDAQAQAIIDEQEWSKAVRELNDEVEGSERKLAAQRMLAIEASKKGAKLLAAIATPQEKYNEKILELKLLLQTTGLSQDEYNKLVEVAKTKLDAATKSSSSSNKELERGKRLTEQYMTPLEIYIERIEELNMLKEKDRIDQGTYNRALGDYQDQLLAGSEATEKASSAAKDLGLTFASAFEDAVLEGGNLTDVLLGLEKDITRIILRKQVTEPLADMIGGIFSGGKSGGGGNIFSGIGKIFGFADGGNVRGNEPIVVGERGPELFVPSGSGAIVSNEKIGQSYNVTNVFNIKSDSGKVDTRSIQQIQTAVGQSMNRAMQRNN